MDVSPDPTGSSAKARKSLGGKVAMVSGFAAVLLLYMLTMRPRASSIEWSSDLRSAVVKAQQAHRPVLLEFHIPSCSACEWMSREVFPRKEVGRALTGWAAVQVDAEANAALAQRFGVSAFPTFIALTPDGRILRRYEGSLTPEEFVAFVKASESQTTTQPSTPPSS